MRDWKKINQKYIREGELYLSFDFLQSWRRELQALNKGKEGARYQYPDSLIRFCSTIKAVFGIGFRQKQGVLSALQQWIPIPAVPSYTQINRRMNALGIDIVKSLAEPSDGEIIAIDATGIKLYNSGEWIREKHKKRKPFLKLHIAVNIDHKQAVAVKVTEDSIGDSKMALPLLEDARKIRPIVKALLDGAFDHYAIWNAIDKRNIQPVIRLRKNAKANGLGIRARCVRKKKTLGEKTYRKKQGYGQRWQAETWFSSFKRRFGEYCYSVKPENVLHEMLMKAELCNRLILG